MLGVLVLNGDLQIPQMGAEVKFMRLIFHFLIAGYPADRINAEVLVLRRHPGIFDDFVDDILVDQFCVRQFIVPVQVEEGRRSPHFQKGWKHLFGHQRAFLRCADKCSIELMRVHGCFPCAVPTVTYFWLRLFGLPGMVIWSCPLSSRGFR